MQRLAGFYPSSDARGQRGVIVFIALIVLVAMTLAALSLIRSTDTGNVISGNLAFKQGTANASETVLESAYRIDLVVGGEVIVEVKAVEELLPVHGAQLQTYLKLSGIQVGLLINFNVRLLKDGLRRIIR